MSIFDAQGRRLYFTDDERKAFMKPAAAQDRETRSFCAMLHYTGCRISEATQLTVRSVDLSARVIVFESLKKRRRGVFRAVPVPPDFLDMLDMVHGIREIQSRGKGMNDLLWPWSRTTAWRCVQHVIKAAGIMEGPHACPRDLRHGFGVQALGKGIPLNMLQKWLGHAQMSTTAIYANAVGEEEQSIAARMW
jgi:integrase/recombinase XerD